MITRPRSSLARTPAPRPHAAVDVGHAPLLAPGDEVSIGGSGAYEIVYLSEGRAWLSGLDDGAQRLADSASLCLRHAAAAPAGCH